MLHSSDPPNPWLGYRNCLTDLPDCTHVLVIQDDAVVCKNFAGAVDAISFTHKDAPVCLFLGGFPQGLASRFKKALRLGQSYIPLTRGPIMPLVAVLWPKAVAEGFLQWTDENPKKLGHPNPAADDGVAGRWAFATGVPVFISVPSLVEHPDMIPSVKGGQPQRWGKDPRRKAVVVAEDGLAYNW